MDIMVIAGYQVVYTIKSQAITKKKQNRSLTFNVNKRSE